MKGAGKPGKDLEEEEATPHYWERRISASLSSRGGDGEEKERGRAVCRDKAGDR